MAASSSTSSTSEVLTNNTAYRNFIHSLRSPKTRIDYIKSLKYYMTWLKVDSYDKLLQYDPKLIASDIIDFIIYCKDQRKLSSASINAYVAAVRHFYEMNDIELKWKKINSFKGELYNVVEDRPYTRQEISLLLQKAEPRNRAIILLLASSGIRVGAVPDIKIKDLEPISEYGIYQITVYKKSKSKYITFCTPEARKEIDSYLQYRERCGERLKPDSPLFRKAFDRNDALQAQNSKPLNVGTVNWILNQLLNTSAVRPPKHMTADMAAPQRTEIMQGHGLRKFFDTTCTNAGMNPVYTEILMGHNLGLKSRYAKPSTIDLLEGNDKNLGYASVINELTINEENRLRKQVQEITIERSALEGLKEEIDQMKAMLGL